MNMASAAEDSEESRLLVADRIEKTAVVTMELDSASSARSSSARSSTLEDVDVDPSLLDNNDLAADRDDPLHQLRFSQLLQRSREEDLAAVEATNCIYRAGYDKHGRAVVVFVGKWFKQKTLDLDKALLYLIKTVEPVASHDYVVMYFHTRTSGENIPSYWWIKEVYNALPYRYKKHLKSFYVVHPTMWTKMTTWWFSTFMAPAIKNKIHNVHAITALASVVDEAALSLPMFITEQDMVLNGIRYYKP